MDLTGTVSALTLLTVWGRDTPAVLWGGTVILGLSMASVFPSAVHMSEQFINVTGKAASVFVVGAAFGEMIMPLLVGKVCLITRTVSHSLIRLLFSSPWLLLVRKHS